METIRKVIHYLAHLEWTEKKQHDCLFCDRSKLKKIVYEDDETFAFEDIRPAGETHWLIVPTEHIRDIESLTSEHTQLLDKMVAVKTLLLAKHHPDVAPSDIHTGFHRGRRPMIGSLFWPDIISIHHIHLHVMVRPRPALKFFKYPSWLPLMWKSEANVLREQARRR